MEYILKKNTDESFIDDLKSIDSTDLKSIDSTEVLRDRVIYKLLDCECKFLRHVHGETVWFGWNNFWWDTSYSEIPIDIIRILFK